MSPFCLSAPHTICPFAFWLFFLALCTRIASTHARSDHDLKDLQGVAISFAAASAPRCWVSRSGVLTKALNAARCWPEPAGHMSGDHWNGLVARNGVTLCTEAERAPEMQAREREPGTNNMPRCTSSSLHTAGTSLYSQARRASSKTQNPKPYMSVDRGNMPEMLVRMASSATSARLSLGLGRGVQGLGPTWH